MSQRRLHLVELLERRSRLRLAETVVELRDAADEEGRCEQTCDALQQRCDAAAALLRPSTLRQEIDLTMHKMGSALLGALAGEREEADGLLRGARDSVSRQQLAVAQHRKTLDVLGDVGERDRMAAEKALASRMEQEVDELWLLRQS